ncbi:MAG: Gfo/Idh/MocA family oxidoreductase [Planctomycetota bacterium]|nr:Gfo/Idh/MocA family oxidoreductase [Planctomycetota bacterium]
MSTRRDFVKVAATSAVVPYFWSSSSIFAQDKNSKPKVAAIGVGGSRGRYNRGGSIAMNAARYGDMIAVCDVDSKHTNEFSHKKQFGGKLNEYTDYRKLLEKEKPEVVTIGTPDHWHVPIAIAALRSGADVYCEKPLTLTIDEGIQISKVVKETGKVFQVGTQQRTENGRNFLKAIALVHLGYLGDNVNAHVAIGGAPGNGPFKMSPPPQGLDWDFWVGPALKSDYCDERRKQFRWYLEYSGGKMTDWGAHHIDIAQWALGKSATSPVSISGKGKFGNAVPDNFDFTAFFAGNAQLKNGFNAATQFNIDLRFDNGALMNVNHHYKSADGKTEFGNGILFTGTKGRIFVNRGKLTGKPAEGLSKDDTTKIDEYIAKTLYKGQRLQNHMSNFFDCLETRQDPVSDVYTHHRTMTSCHMCNITLMLGRSLKYDAKAEKFIGDDQANALMKRPSRQDYLA